MALCARCTHPDCERLVIIPALHDGEKVFNLAARRLDVVCPACARPFWIPVVEMICCEVKDDDLVRRFIARNSEVRARS